jgi:formate dehydrogenase subunit gamma
VRFDGLERAVHWVTALLFVILIATGACLYVPPLVGLVGRRVLLVRIHVGAGLALPVPLVAGFAGPWGKALRADVRRLNRWGNGDRHWLRAVSRLERPREPASGKFNAGQKLFAAFTVGVMAVMLMTGCVMRWFSLWPLSWRTGATFVHDLVAYLLVVAIIAHIAMALAHPSALRSMLTGRVSRAWAERRARSWLEEVDVAAGAGGAGAGGAGAGGAAAGGMTAQPVGGQGPDPAAGPWGAGGVDLSSGGGGLDPGGVDAPR